ncbi:tRNA (adenine(22)-N(1))-methyltransferase [Paenisporosarcina indica]|uniref:tRNA (adenine(22)-N(1))-methyltransferase n=1 Tax=Paenisporosarcina indica TaxID=650093 RepID=UPI00094F71A6|nr:tRNA (adenine(22)-N(1))-methyltransferase TrmK [Paenisporosarcina indica]
MNAQHLSERLMRVAGYVKEGAVVADIGSDHAYLPCYLIHHKLASKAIAGEVAKGPFESAQSHVNAEQFQDQITVRLANGLKAIEQEDDVDTVTIAGMGGPLIAMILDQDKDRLASVSRLILQPNVYAKAIRDWAELNGWKLIAEDILQEDNKIYEILVLEKGKMTLSPSQKLLGPFLMDNQNDVFTIKWKKESAEWNRILEAIRFAELSGEVQLKKEEVQQKLKIVKEALGE